MVGRGIVVVVVGRGIDAVVVVFVVGGGVGVVAFVEAVKWNESCFSKNEFPGNPSLILRPLIVRTLEQSL